MQDAQSAGFFCVENPAAPAVQCLVWTALSLLYIYNKKQRRSTTVLALSVKACRLCQLPRGGSWHRAAMTERVRAVLPQEAGAADAGRLYDPTREKVNRENPQIFPIGKFKIILPLKMRRATRSA